MWIVAWIANYKVELPYSQAVLSHAPIRRFFVRQLSLLGTGASVKVESHT